MCAVCVVCVCVACEHMSVVYMNMCSVCAHARVQYVCAVCVVCVMASAKKQLLQLCSRLHFYLPTCKVLVHSLCCHISLIIKIQWIVSKFNTTITRN